MIYKVYTEDMKSKITKWGNSYGVRIPRALVEKLKLQNAEVDVIQEGKNVKLVPIKKKEETLEDLVKLITPENRHELIMDDVLPVGKELW
jgi:antitoxin MazE